VGFELELLDVLDVYRVELFLDSKIIKI